MTSSFRLWSWAATPASTTATTVRTPVTTVAGVPTRSASTSVQTSSVSGSASVSMTGHDVLRRGHLGQPHRAAGVQLLRGDADLGAEPELAAVGEPGAGVHHDRGRVDHGAEPLGGVQRSGDDGLRVAGRVPTDVLDGRLQGG